MLDQLEPSQLDKKFSVRNSYCFKFSFPPYDLLSVEQLSDKLLHICLILRTMVLPWKPTRPRDGKRVSQGLEDGSVGNVPAMQE